MIQGCIELVQWRLRVLLKREITKSAASDSYWASEDVEGVYHRRERGSSPTVREGVNSETEFKRKGTQRIPQRTQRLFPLRTFAKASASSASSALKRILSENSTNP